LLPGWQCGRLCVAAGLRRALVPLPARPVVTAMMPPVPWRLYLIDLLSPEMQEWLVVPCRHREIPVDPARFQDDDEGPVVRGRRTLWPAFAFAGQ
jgi:hypothetical protein